MHGNADASHNDEYEGDGSEAGDECDDFIGDDDSDVETLLVSRRTNQDDLQLW